MKIRDSVPIPDAGATLAKRVDLAEAEKISDDYIDPDAVRYYAVRDVLKKMPPDFLQSLAELARIPDEPERRRVFRDVMLNILFDSWKAGQDRDAGETLQQNKAFKKAIDALKSAKQAVTHLSESHREMYWWQVFGVEESIDRFLIDTVAEVVPIRRQRRGRPTGTVKDLAFYNFVRGLLECASHFGGRFTFQKRTGRGTWIKAIVELAPYLPEGFVPNVLPRTTLQRIMTGHRRQLRSKPNPETTN